jgi:hypothetical protein
MSIPFVRRVEILEERVNSLSELPDRVAAVERQVVALCGEVTSFRAEVRNEFAAMRADLRGEMRDGFAAVRADLRAEMHAGDEETRRYVRVLHEDVISRIALLQESVERSNGKSGGATHPRRRLQ